MLPANFLRRVAGCGGGVIGGRALSSFFPGRRVVSVTHGHSHISSSHKSHHGCHNIGQQRRMIQSLLARHKCVTVGLGSLELSSSMSTAELKKRVISAVAQSLRVSSTDDAAVVLVSRSLAPWLEDQAFMAGLLEATTSDETGRELSVLSAAVDEVPRFQGAPSSSEGLSVLRGSSTRVLPGLWEVGSNQTFSPSQQLSFLELRLPGLQPKAEPLQVTVPLANTIFTTGKSHALFASKWRHDPAAARKGLSMAASVEKTTQTILLPGYDQSSASTVYTALVPVTRPHKIVAGLGNILRQVEVGVKPEPASKELEAIIPALLKKRLEHSESDELTYSGPVGVWALIMPEGAVDQFPIPNPLDVQNYDPSSEWDLVHQTSQAMDGLIAAGCQLRKILSGGGGWGLKQGLLSLDPNTRYAREEHEDMESFIRSFKREDATGGIVTPGSYVQFFTEAIPPTEKTRLKLAWPSDRPTFAIGTSGGKTSEEVETFPDLFGAVSSEGVYISSEENAAITTKLDAPQSYVVSHASEE
ncbi:uncharacterized protein PODANS_1_10470 [Podospora anserina S mat+]|uniref:Podospora anserina S mat+ genomic DNA chromosome 1, supercontig 2 n=1 Tax=Podospora anserina (strain S / ATCC MYA-4624 / DSM 980 / FGSC 10383) TaxID=515849 RepID=B2AYA9_PODAN|nr:uncharacterized protein PODANS_1_10470 [Podospora anserina S mat+]CAP69383.1 unnamed protein product [Podospora anserina S mat+]CDP23404.1 Putative protein of unknown function [Podospora anserina S mat+]